ncbi:beta-galactosidase BgaS [Thermofilum pendens]|nr:beta-galactosidase BgaS [Thermofilum pendens]
MDTYKFFYEVIILQQGKDLYNGKSPKNGKGASNMSTMMFPQKFRWGVSESGFQFEMGDEYRRFIDTNTDWWHWVRDPHNISSRLVSGDLPEDGINYFELFGKDHELARELGLNTYRLGIEWSRIFPHPTWFIEVDFEKDSLGFVKSVRIDEDTLRALDRYACRKAVQMYREILLDLRKRGFKVIVNLVHFTLPYWIHDPIRAKSSELSEGPLGLLEESFPIEMAKYAAYVAWKFGDLVDMWSTFNEPVVPIELGYLGTYTGFPPGVNKPQAVPKALVNTAIAHALAYDMIKKFDNVKADPDSNSPAEVGLIYNIIPAYSPEGTKSEKAVEHYSYFHNELLLEAVKNGRLDVALDGKNILKPAALGGKLDWLGVNYYTRIVVKESSRRFNGHPVLDFEAVAGYGYACVPFGLSKIGRACDGMGWEFYPEGLIDALRIGSTYASKLLVTENGTSDPRDVIRPSYLVNHLYALLLAIEEGINVEGYLHWALTDNYEWAHGFRQRFGLFEVDLITKSRIPRHSSRIYKHIIQQGFIPSEYKKDIVEFRGI